MNRFVGRTLVLGLDGFDFHLAMRLAQRGELPWLRGQLQRASLIFTHCSTLPGSEWVNAACGVGAARHRYVHTSQLRIGTYEQVETDAGIVEAQPFYVPLARSGLKTIIIDLPVDRPRPTKNLTQVVDWGTEFKLWRYATTPRSVQRFVDRTSPGNPLTNYGGTRPDDATLRELRKHLSLACTLKGRLVREFMRRHADWSVLFAGFGEIHKGGHFFWQYQDPGHPNYPGADHPLATALVELYQQLDRELASVCAAAGEGVDVVVVADRGMRANYRGDHLMIPFLQQLGLYPSASNQHSNAAGDAEEQRTAFGRREPLLRQIKRRIPVAIRPMMRRLGGFELAWDRIQVFPVSEVGNSYFRVNLRNREPRGTVGAGSEYEALLERLCDEFKALVNPATGKCPIEEVVFPQREFAGPFSSELPDIGVVWADHAPIEALVSPSIGRIEGTHWEQRSGNHTSRGAMLVAGPSFVAGSSRQGDLRELAPTLLALHGLPVPPLYECDPVPELLVSNSMGLSRASN